MKEVQGELNSTLIVMVSVGVLMTFFFSFIWPLIRHNFQSEAQCGKAACDCSAQTRNDNEGYCSCSIKGGETFRCVYKG